MTLRERYNKFQQWQRQPVKYHKSGERHTCNNCNEDFTGNYCPTCGQKATVGPVTWDSIRQGVMDLWGIGTRSLPYTLWQLFTRPGYLIGDYISGRRQTSFPPVKMLVIVALVIFVLGKLFGLQFDTIESMADFSDDKDSIFFQFSQWLLKHYDWLTLFLFMAMVLPTYIVFRYAPHHPRHTLPQGFFIQVFNSTQFLCLAFMWAVINRLVNLHLEGDMVTVLLLFPLLLFYNYKQLFGYGTWGTVWRMFACWMLWILSFVFLIQIDGLGYDILRHKDLNKTLNDSFLLSFDIFLIIYIVFMTYAYNRWNWYHLRQGKWKNIKDGMLLFVLATTSTFCFTLSIGAFWESVEHQKPYSYYIETAIFLISAVISSFFTYRLYRKHFGKRKENL